MNIAGTKMNYTNIQAGWFDEGGKRYYMRSNWERNYARVLNLLKENKIIKDWQYEPRKFIFDKISTGTRCYIPDFRVEQDGGGHYWVEVKGYYDKKSKTKLARMRRYYPDETIYLVGADWYKQNAPKFSKIIKTWEKPEPKRTKYIRELING